MIVLALPQAIVEQRHLARLDKHGLARGGGLVDDPVDVALIGNLDGHDKASVTHVADGVLEHAFLGKGFDRLIEDRADLALERADLRGDGRELRRGALGELAFGREDSLDSSERLVRVGELGERFLETLAADLLTRDLCPRVQRIKPAADRREFRKL
ncbi:MAG: hypothetical protein ACXVBW_03105 [Bdellovibrionota bacterium]